MIPETDKTEMETEPDAETELPPEETPYGGYYCESGNMQITAIADEAKPYEGYYVQ